MRPRLLPCGPAAGSVRGTRYGDGPPPTSARTKTGPAALLGSPAPGDAGATGSAGRNPSTTRRRTMILATRIPQLTAQMRAATLRAADEQPDAVPDRRLIER